MGGLSAPSGPAEQHTSQLQSGAFTSFPTLDLSLIESPQGKTKFLVQLREALVVVGFFYLINIERFVPPGVQDAFVQRSQDLLNLPLEKKLEIDMMNSKHFLGYSQNGKERTAQKLDNREMFDVRQFMVPVSILSRPDRLAVSTPCTSSRTRRSRLHECAGSKSGKSRTLTLSSSELTYKQWLDERDAPGFRHAFDTYMAAVGKLGEVMNTLVAEALGLDPMVLMRFFASPPRNKVSLLKYPEPILFADSPISQGYDSGSDSSEASRPVRYTSSAGDDEEFQGVGPHKDGGFLTYLLQATAHAGLEVQNKCGNWISMPPLANSLVVNVGRSSEAITGGVCTATTHRVNLSAKKFLDADGCPLGPRYSFPVFQTLKMDLTSREMASLRIPDTIKDLVDGQQVASDAERYFEKYHLESPGVGISTARITSHPGVGWKWYPDMTDRILRGQAECG